jgi:hypothetical protein
MFTGEDGRLISTYRSSKRDCAAGAALIGKNGLSEPAPMTAPVPFLDGRQSIQRLWVDQLSAIVGLLKKVPLFLTFFFSNLFYKLTNPILGLATPFHLPLPAFLVGPTL